MKLSQAEARALAFVALLLLLSGAARLLDRPAPVTSEEPPLDLAGLEAASRSALAAAERSRQPLARGERIDPNTAPVAELERLPRVGRALAERIVAQRARGRFASAADLARVPGIGPRLLELISPHLALPPGAPDVSAPPAGGAASPPLRGGAPATPAQTSALDLNRATAAELEALPGVGPVLARRIQAYRDSVGGFRSLDQLQEVPGIGPGKLERLRPHLRAP